MKANTSMSILIIAIFLVGALAGVYPASNASAASGGQPELATLVLQNRSSGQVILHLSGPKEYTFVLNPGKVKVQLLPGKYTYSYNACGAPQMGKIRLPQAKKLNTILCSLVKITVINYINHPFTLRLFGPGQYTFTVEHGTNIFNILKGKYHFEASTKYCGGLAYADGNITIEKGFKWPWWCGSH